METGHWFSIRFITANLAKGTGGEIRELSRVRIARSDGNNNTTAGKAAVVTKSMITRNPQHHANFTRNLETIGKQIVKVHPILITHINNAEVI